MSSDLKDRLPATTAPGTAVARTEQRSAAEMVRSAIETQSLAFKAVLPSHVDGDRFSRLVLTAVKASPDLMQCFGTVSGQTSVLLSAMQAAAIGLEPNTPLQDCWLLPRRNKGTMECELSIGYRGLLKLARRSGTIKTIRAEVVHEKDDFEYSYGLEGDVLEHTPTDDVDPGELTHVYAIVRYKDDAGGGYASVVLTKRQVEARRAMSASWKNTGSRPYSPWTQWTDEMWRKTAIRALVPHLELQTEVAAVLSREEQPLVLTQEGVIDVAPAAEPPADPMTDAQSRALHALLKRKMDAAGDARFPVLSDMLGRDITSTKELSLSDASGLIDTLNEMGDHVPVAE